MFKLCLYSLYGSSDSWVVQVISCQCESKVAISVQLETFHLENVHDVKRCCFIALLHMFLKSSIMAQTSWLNYKHVNQSLTISIANHTAQIDLYISWGCLYSLFASQTYFMKMWMVYFMSNFLKKQRPYEARKKRSTCKLSGYSTRLFNQVRVFPFWVPYHRC